MHNATQPFLLQTLAEKVSAVMLPWQLDNEFLEQLRNVDFQVMFAIYK